jgi:hypothetical protein
VRNITVASVLHSLVFTFMITIVFLFLVVFLFIFLFFISAHLSPHPGGLARLKPGVSRIRIIFLIHLIIVVLIELFLV